METIGEGHTRTEVLVIVVPVRLLAIGGAGEVKAKGRSEDSTLACGAARWGRKSFCLMLCGVCVPQSQPCLYAVCVCVCVCMCVGVCVMRAIPFDSEFAKITRCNGSPLRNTFPSRLKLEVT